MKCVIRWTLLLIVLSQTMFAAETLLPKIGDPLGRKDIPNSAHRNRCLTHSVQMDPCFERQIGGVQYTIAFDEETHRVTYLSTKDSAFQTADGYKIGDEIEVSWETLRVIPGWEIYAPNDTQEGWRPIVGFDLELQLKDGTKINLRGKPHEGTAGKARIVGFSKGRL